MPRPRNITHAAERLWAKDFAQLTRFVHSRTRLAFESDAAEVAALMLEDDTLTVEAAYALWRDAQT